MSAHHTALIYYRTDNECDRISLMVSEDTVLAPYFPVILIGLPQNRDCAIRFRERALYFYSALFQKWNTFTKAHDDYATLGNCVLFLTLSLWSSCPRGRSFLALIICTSCSHPTILWSTSVRPLYSIRSRLRLATTSSAQRRLSLLNSRIVQDGRSYQPFHDLHGWKRRCC